MLNILEKIKYDVLRFPVPSMPRINIPEEGILFEITEDKNGGFNIVSSNLLGLITYAETKSQIPLQIEDAILSYFAVPRYLAKKYFDFRFVLKGNKEGTKYIISPRFEEYALKMHIK